MKIKILTNLMTASKSYRKGEVVEVKDQEGLALIESNLAEKFDPKAEAEAKKVAAKETEKPKVETATDKTKSEKATQDKK